MALSFKHFCCGGFALAGLITVIIVLCISFHSLDQLSFALDFNTITQRIDSKVYTTAGLYFLGPGHEFIKYPRTIQTIEFIASDGDRLQTRTSDGLPVSLSISFQYRYDDLRLMDNYLTFKQQELQVYEATSKAVIANVATNFTAYNFFNDKQSIAHAMRIQVAHVFDRDLFARIDAFQITRVELPSQFQSAILRSIEAKQNITQMKRYKENMQVTFQTDLMVANQTKQQTIALAHGTAAQRREEAEAYIALTQQTVYAEMYAYGNFTSRVGLGEAESLDYIWWNTQLDQNSAGKEYLVGVDPALLTRSTASP